MTTTNQTKITYILKKDCPNIGKEVGDYYNNEYAESIEQLLKSGVIEEEIIEKTNQTKREGFEKMLNGLSVEIWSGNDMNILWSWIEAYKDQAVSEERERIKDLVRETLPMYITVNHFDQYNPDRHHLLDKISRLTPKEVTKQSDEGEIK